MQDVLALSVPFFGLIFIGFLVGKLADVPESGLAWLNVFIIYVALPALFFQLLAKTPIAELTNGRFMLAILATTSTIFTTGFLVGLIRGRGRIPTATMMALVGSYGNIGYLGPGLALAAFGAAATVPVALIFSLENAMFFIVTPILMAVGGGAALGVRGTAALIVRRIFTHPFILATIAGFVAAATSFHPPAVIDTLLVMLRSAAAPCALFAIGVTVALRPLERRDALPELSLLLSLKLLGHPLLVYTMLSLAGVGNPLWISTAITMASLPPATNVFVLATQYQTYVRRASTAIVVGTTASVVTVTAVLYVLKNGLLPSLF